MDFSKKIIELLEQVNEPMKQADISKELNIDSKDISKAIKDLKEQGKIFSPKRCFYQFKK